MHLCTLPQPLFMSASQSGHGLGAYAITFFILSSRCRSLPMPLASLTTLLQAAEIIPRWEFRRRRPAQVVRI